MASKYDNSQWTRCFRTGGALRVTLNAAGLGQGNGGTSLPCRGCWVQPGVANTSQVRINIGTAASDTVGVGLAFWSGGVSVAAPWWIPISDVSELYFYSAQAYATIDILYVTG